MGGSAGGVGAGALACARTCVGWMGESFVGPYGQGAGRVKAASNGSDIKRFHYDLPAIPLREAAREWSRGPRFVPAVVFSEERSVVPASAQQLRRWQGGFGGFSGILWVDRGALCGLVGALLGKV